MAVSISGVSGTLTHGSTLTITGSGFGTHADYGVSETFINACWNDFSVGLDDGNIARSSQVNEPEKWTLQTSGARGGVATTFARKILGPADTAGIGRLGSLEYLPPDNVTCFFTSFWFKTGASATHTSGKWYRHWFEGYDYWCSNGAAGEDESQDWIGNGTHGQNTIYGSGAATNPLTGSVWHYVEIIEFVSGGTTAGYGSTDYLEWRLDNVRLNRRGSGLASNHIAAEGSVGNENETWTAGDQHSMFTHNVEWGEMINYDADDAGDPALSSYNFSDIYASHTIARVMVGSASTFAACTGFEMQLPTVWDSGGGSITITANRGALAALTGNYLYVMAEDGSVNANGFQLAASAGVTRSPRLRRLLRKKA